MSKGQQRRSTKNPINTLRTSQDATMDDLIQKLAYPSNTDSVKLSVNEVINLCKLARSILLAQPMLLELSPPVKLCGDIHGQYSDLLRIFRRCGFPPETNYLFLGDYVDRGRQSVETITLLLAYKVRYPNTFFLLRGNHESAVINRTYGFFEECLTRYNFSMWEAFVTCFDCMPVAAIVANRVFCCHGGLSPELHEMSDILDLPRPCEVPEQGLLCDLLWSDPNENQSSWQYNDRGAGYKFGADIVEAFVKQHNFDLIVRAHQVVVDGFEFFAKRKLITIFSAPNYCNIFDNCAAIMTISSSLVCSFEILVPVTKSDNNEVNNKSAPQPV